jgi:hypothetical protein
LPAGSDWRVVQNGSELPAFDHHIGRLYRRFGTTIIRNANIPITLPLIVPIQTRFIRSGNKGIVFFEKPDRPTSPESSLGKPPAKHHTDDASDPTLASSKHLTHNAPHEHMGRIEWDLGNLM